MVVSATKRIGGGEVLGGTKSHTEFANTDQSLYVISPFLEFQKRRLQW